ncbi:DUF2842 domain-containing protein [Sphingorhabdus sp. Alg239-R122]|uniref:DUF2842 domain-containing protein n=1 Tax=Sphingorhabdus sp. Alg239-R122 TaxID=2305989 RepID=UPI0013DAFE47|nr:DUF2842 domain-containing protein [Sphingorhabdus sp. Alg239-R122]
MEPTWRKPVGILAILLLITIWCVLVVTVVGWIGGMHVLLQILIYLVTGIIWILPLRPLMIWMETGYFKAPEDKQ